MSKYYLSFVLIITSLALLGCGGGSGTGGVSTPNVDLNDPGPTPGADDTNSGFKYPWFFDSYADAVTNFEERTSIHVGFAVQEATATLRGVVGASVSITSMSTGALLSAIDGSPDVLSRATSCEHGELNVISYSYSDVEGDPDFGEFQMSNFSGVGVKTKDLDLQDDDCPIGYMDGYIKYGHSGQFWSAKFGTNIVAGNNFISEGEPFFLGGYGNFDASYGILGTWSLEFPDPDSSESMILKTGFNKSLEIFQVEADVGDFTRGPYTKFNRVKFRNVTISSIVGEDKTTFNANYIREWDEFGETFILFTEIKDLVYLNDVSGTKDVLSGTVKFKLTVDGKSDRYVDVDVSYGLAADDVKVTYKKEGVSSQNF